jgi:hypothetical protein
MDLLKVEISRIVLDGNLNIYIFAINKRPIIILKIDFEKAFDKVEYLAIISMLNAKGYGPKWISLVENILHSTSTYVLLNGVLGKKHCKRVVRQGDPHYYLAILLNSSKQQ